MLSFATIKRIATKYKLRISAQSYTEAQAKAAQLKLSPEEVLLQSDAVDEQTFFPAAAKFLDVPFISLKGKEIKKEVLNLVPPLVAGTHQLVAFDTDKDGLKIAMTDPTDVQIIEFLRRKTGLAIKPYLTTPADIKDILRQYHGELADEFKIIQESSGQASSGDLKKVAEELPVINVVNSILDHAVFQGASDIHIEPGEKDIIVRYRVDGILKPVMTLPKAIQNGVLARIKILSNLKLDEHMVPQDGRFKIQVQEEKLSFRVSVIPVYDGEKVVMRLLHEGAKPLTLDQLGFLNAPKKVMEEAVTKAHGMILVTGPTGSGKTTTLYSVLGMLNKPGVNISTIEDPIEYRMAGVNQSQVNPKAGFTFAGGLRALLRQDPNIIMVGEIRDQETANIAINAAMTGHLVLSTLHTNDAPTALPRLMDMGVPPFLVAYTTNVIIAQRLLRKLCPSCRKAKPLTKEVRADMSKLADYKKIITLAENEIVAQRNSGGQAAFYENVGCRKCGDSGYKGRLGIYEVLPLDDALAKLISAHADTGAIKDHALAHGMTTMLEDGLVKAALGLTTISEVLRVSKE